MDGCERPPVGLLVVIGLIVGAVFLTDIAIPLGVASGMVYVGAVMLTLWSPERRLTLMVALVCTVLTIVGLFISPVGGEGWQVLSNRGLSVVVMWAAALLVLQRKQSEAALEAAKGELELRVQELSRLTSILDATTDFVGIADTHEQLLYLNTAGRCMLGIPETAPLKIKAADFIPEQSLKLLRETGAPGAIENGAWIGEMVIVDGEGREIPVSSVVIAHDAPPGEIECFSTIMRDITDQQHARDLLAHRADEMETFAYSASHDLQSPLRTFEGYARWLLEDYGEILDEQGRGLCEEIIADAMHMKMLLDGLLEYSRIGRLDTEPVVVQVKDVLEWVLHDLQLEIADTDATVQVPEVLPAVVYPEGRLTQIFSNLLSNALKFTAAGRAPEIAIGWQETPCYHQFSVRDNGIGIAAEHYERIFEIFKRLHTREEYSGTGAGLTIVKRIVETHGGEIGVDGLPGEGSTFWVTIPKRPQRARDERSE